MVTDGVQSILFEIRSSANIRKPQEGFRLLISKRVLGGSWLQGVGVCMEKLT